MYLCAYALANNCAPVRRMAARHQQDMQAAQAVVRHALQSNVSRTGAAVGMLRLQQDLASIGSHYAGKIQRS